MRDPVREQVEAQIGEPVRKRVWEYLADGPLLALARQDSTKVPVLVREYRRLDQHFPEKRRRRAGEQRERTTPGDERTDSLALLLARRAERLPQVRDYRARHLGGGVLPWSDLESWVTARAPARDDHAGTLVRFTGRLLTTRTEAEALMRKPQEEYATALAEAIGTAPGRPGRGYEVPSIECACEDGNVIQAHVPVSGPLFDLYGVCEWLTLQDFPAGWAATLVLCGVAPRIPRLRVEVRGAWPLELSTVAVEANRRATAAEVAREYTWAAGSGRDKPMLARNMALAVCADAWREDDGSWTERRDEWNSMCDGRRQKRAWRFSSADDPQARNFANVARAAWRRLTGEEWS